VLAPFDVDATLDHENVHTGSDEGVRSHRAAHAAADDYRIVGRLQRDQGGTTPFILAYAIACPRCSFMWAMSWKSTAHSPTSRP
jgi:hypothetical protein